MIANLKLSHKLVLITALLALPLSLVTTMYVRQTREMNLDALEQQMAALPLLKSVEQLTRQMQDYSAGIPLWILGTERSSDQAPVLAKAIDQQLQDVLQKIRRLDVEDKDEWEALSKRIHVIYSGDTAVPRSFTEYTDLTAELIYQTRLLAFKFKLYSGTDQLIIINRMILDLAPALAANINQLRGLVTYKIFVNERTFEDVAAISGYQSLVLYRYKEIDQSLNAIASSEPKLYAELSAIRDTIDSEIKEVMRLIQIYIDRREENPESTRFYQQSSEVISSIYRFSEQGSQFIQQQLAAQHHSQTTTLRILVALASVSGFLVLLMIYAISRSFVSGVRQIEIVTEQIAKGNRQLRFPTHLAGHEVQAIMGEIHRIHDAITVYEEQTRINTWLLEEQKTLNDQLRSVTHLNEFAQRCLTTVAASIKADVASFYRIGDEHYELCFAYGVNAPARIVKGQGLLGAAVIDRHMRVYDAEEIPADYPHLESSLGNAAPRNLLIFPVHLEDEVVAVMEFLSLHRYEPTSLRFLNAIEENTAILMRTLLARLQVAELLETTRHQSQTLRDTNASLEEKTQQLNEQQKLLQQVNQELEEQRSELEIQNEHLESALRDLSEAKREADVANQSKSIFLANISHELRTPLNSIMILSQVMSENREGNLVENQISNANTIHSAGRDLLKLINEILDLSKIEAGKIDITPSLVMIDDIATDIRNMYQPLAQKKQIDFTVQVTSDTPASVETDSVRITQIIRNFVGNAIKFTERGGVKVRFARSVEAGYALTVSVQDSGIGIPKDQFDLIFEPFKQLNNSLSRKHEGTGLGLAISRNLAGKLGARIDVQSEMGSGSCFTLHMPAQLPEGGDQATPALVRAPVETLPDDRLQMRPNEPTILIVEDDVKFAAFLQERCHERRFRTLVSIQGDDCLELAERYQPHGIILDIKLPHVDGLDLLAQLKSNARTRHIPVHVISFSDREKEALGRGAISFVQKPVPVDKLDEILKSLAQPADDRSHVLLAVSDARECSEIKGLFAAGTLDVDILPNGKALLDQLGSRDYACLITSVKDLVDGQFQLLEQISRDKRHVALPIVIFGSRDTSIFDQQRLASYRETLSIREVASMERLLDDVNLFIHSVDSRILLRDAIIPENVFEHKKILIVDDDIRNIYALRQILHGRGCEIMVASNGLEALQTLDENPDINLVLMDIMMPELDGYEATRRIRSNPRFARLPIIALTAKAMKNDRKLCLDAGASDYLVKPIDNDRIVTLMRVWLSR